MPARDEEEGEEDEEDDGLALDFIQKVAAEKRGTPSGGAAEALKADDGELPVPPAYYDNQFWKSAPGEGGYDLDELLADYD